MAAMYSIGSEAHVFDPNARWIPDSKGQKAGCNKKKEDEMHGVRMAGARYAADRLPCIECDGMDGWVLVRRRAACDVGKDVSGRK